MQVWQCFGLNFAKEDIHALYRIVPSIKMARTNGGLSYRTPSILQGLMNRCSIPVKEYKQMLNLFLKPVLQVKLKEKSFINTPPLTNTPDFAIQRLLRSIAATALPCSQNTCKSVSHLRQSVFKRITVKSSQNDWVIRKIQRPHCLRRSSNSVA